VVIDNGIASAAQGCDIKPSWNAAICEGDFGRLWLRASDGKPGTGPFNQTTGGSEITLSRNGREIITGKPGFFGPGFGNTTVSSGAEIRVTTESAALDVSLNELNDGAWVIFQFPGFTSANSGREQQSLDALRNARETSYYRDDGDLWVKVVIADSSAAVAPFPPFGGGADIKVTK
jgi:cell migration-inducing and hyaluronan-binding protein